MLLQNVKLSSIHSYLKEFNKRKKKGQTIKTTSSLYDNDRNDVVYFRQENFKTTLSFSEDIILKEIQYRGYLEYTYYKRFNMLCISHVPYVQYGDVKIPLLTSDIVKLIADSLFKYTDLKNLKVITKDNSSVIVIDEEAINILPSLRDTNNYSLLKRVIQQIDGEIHKVLMDVERYKDKKKKEEISREIAIAKKRRIYGLDPNTFESYEDFLNNLSNLLSDIYRKKIQNILRHIESSKVAYREIFQTLLSDTEKQLFNEIANSYENLFQKISKFLGININLTFLDFIDYSNEQSDEEWFISDEFWFLRNFIINNCSDLSEEQAEKVDSELDYFIDENLEGINEALQKLDNYVRQDEEKKAFLLRTYYEIERGNNDYDFDSEIISLLKQVREEASSYKKDQRKIVEEELSYEALYLWKADESFSVALLRVLEENEEDPEFYHPIFRGKIDREHYDMNFKLIKRASSILLQIDALRTQYEYYQSIVGTPLKALSSFSKDSNLWGNIMQMPYFIRKDIDPFDHKETFNLLMIKPGITEVDFNNIKYFSADYGKRFGRRCTERVKIYMKETEEDNCDRLMICIPSSISIKSLQEILDYAYRNGSNLNFVCENSETAIIVKSLVIDLEFKNFEEASSYYSPKEVFINVDYTYYEAFMVETPGNKVFWHKYDYTSQHRYRRSNPLSFTQQLLIAISNILERGEPQVRVEEVKILLLGDYFYSETTEYMEYQRLLKQLSSYVFLRESWENYDYDLEKKLKYSLDKR